jgi:tRNA(adenine34) deaminase
MDDLFIDLQSDEYFMREAVRQARKAFDREEVPIGAVIVHEGKMIARAYNQVELLKDATAHAEILALTQASEGLGDWRLNGCTLYVTKEPCPMCSGAMVLSRVDRLVFGASDPKGGGAGGLFQIVSHPSLNHRIEIKSDVLGHECTGLLKEFFRIKRKKIQ